MFGLAVNRRRGQLFVDLVDAALINAKFSGEIMRILRFGLVVQINADDRRCTNLRLHAVLILTCRPEYLNFGASSVLRKSRF